MRFQDLIHSWVGYELVKVLQTFGLTPTICPELEDWLPDLFHVFTYIGDKKRERYKEEADKILTTLFSSTLHNSYFTKLSFGSRANFEKMPNAILPLVVLTWLRQLQEYFFELGDTKEEGDWNKNGKYCAVKAGQVEKNFPLDSMHMKKANNTANVKIDSLEHIKPDHN
jgi:hypothetical protein